MCPSLILSLLLFASSIRQEGAPTAAQQQAEQEWTSLEQDITLKILSHKENLQAGRPGVSFQNEIAAVGRYFARYRDLAPDYAWSARVFLASHVLADALGQQREAAQILRDVVVQAPSAVVAGFAALSAAEIYYRLREEAPIRQLRELYVQRASHDEQFASLLEDMARKTAVLPGRVFPPFGGTDLSGELVRLESMRDRFVLLFFFNIEHPGSRGFLARVAELSADLPAERLAIVGVSLDQDREALRRHLKSLGVEFPVLFDGEGWESSLARSVGVTVLPSSWILSTEGKILHVDIKAAELGELLRTTLEPD